MAENGESSVSSGQKAIGSLTKRPSDVTRQGTQRLKFVPTLPPRRKKEEIKQETPQPPIQPSPDKGNARGRGRGRRRGEGRGTMPIRPPPNEMTASGPFAMGPALANTSARRSNLSNAAAPTLKKDKQRENMLVDAVQTTENESDENYSEPDEGVEIIDMENVRHLDWMAPEILHKDRRDRRKRSVKTEIEDSLLSDSNQEGLSIMNVDPSNALNLSESEEEEDLEDLIEDFAIEPNVAEEGSRQKRLYFFQFPEPFPIFVSTSASDGKSSREMDVATPAEGTSSLKRKVSFAADAKPPAPVSGSTTPANQLDADTPKELPKVDGVIGRLEVYRSGAVKMRLGNGIVLNVSEATQPSFLQQAVHLDMENKKLHVLGEVNKRFVVSPDLDILLASLESADASTVTAALDNPNLIQMNTI